MSDVLSASEIAKLFEAAKQGNLPEGPRQQARRRSVRKVDFSRPMKLSPSEQKRFEQAHANFCRDASVRLSSELRSSIELEVIGSSQLSWQSALGDVPQPAILGVARCDPGEGMILLAIEEGLVLRMIERLLGGSYTERQPSRSLTEIEAGLARYVFERLLCTLSVVWEELLALSTSFVGLELQDTSLEYLSPSQPTIELTIELRDALAASTILLLVPHNAIESAGKSLADSRSPADGASEGTAAGGLRGALGGVRVQVRAEAGAVGLTLGEVLSLGQGDVIRLGEAGAAGIAVGANRLHHARPGLSGGRRAVQILDVARGRS
jgi:flagellar motor switch protein FliM